MPIPPAIQRPLVALSLAALLPVGVACSSKSGTSAFCGQARAFNEALAPLSQSSGSSNAADAAAIVSQLRQASKAVDDLAKTAPSEIKDDFATVADVVHKLVTVLGGQVAQLRELTDLSKQIQADPAKAQDPTVVAKLQQLQTGLQRGLAGTDQEKANQAGERIRQYIKKHCGFDPSATSTTKG